MSKAKYFLFGSFILFGVVGMMGYLKKAPDAAPLAEATEDLAFIEDIEIPQSVQAPIQKVIPIESHSATTSIDPLSKVDQISRLFAFDSSRFPFVETISYTSRVPWMKDRPAWISDYASHYETSRHFIARSLNRKPDYFTQKVGPGDRFNVFKKDAKIHFHLVVDLSKTLMCFYCIDEESNERTLLKTYQVGLGRKDSQRLSGHLTPTGKYELGEKIAIYKPGTMGFFQDERTEMIRVFGTRWIPFEKEIEGCSEAARGYGIHGAPWTEDALTKELKEDQTKLGKYESDGCICLAQTDLEELFAIIITKPTTIEIVQHLADAKLPGVEK